MKIRFVFVWRGIDRLGQRVHGRMIATHKKSVKTTLENQCITVLTVRRVLLWPTDSSFSGRQIVLFTEQLSQLILAGLSLSQALSLIATNQSPILLTQWIQTLKKNIDNGMTLTASLAQYPQYFNAIYCGMVHAGEQTGKLGETLKELACYLDSINSFKNKIRKTLYYPVFIFAVTLLISIGLICFVIPQFQETFASFNAPLPFLTQVLIMITNFLRKNFLFFIPIILLLYFIIKSLIKNHSNLLLRLPIIKQLIIHTMLTVFTKILLTTLSAGIPLIDAIQMAIGAVPNVSLRNQLGSLPSAVSQGNSLYAAMSHCPFFPKTTIQLILIGESSGKLVPMLEKITKNHQQQYDDLLAILTALLEPGIMVLLAVFATLLIIALYIPIFRMGALL